MISSPMDRIQSKSGLNACIQIGEDTRKNNQLEHFHRTGFR